MSRTDATFKWTEEEWAVLEPLTPEQRMDLCVKAIFSKRGLIGEARAQGLTRGGGMADTPGYRPRRG